MRSTFSRPPAIPDDWWRAYDALADGIRAQANGRRVLFITHPGNWGDALIIEGTRNFLAHYKIAYSHISARNAIRRADDVQRTIERYSPSEFMPLFSVGGVVEPYYRYIEKLRVATHAYGGGVILPGTCGFNQAELGLHRDSVFWVRDKGKSAVNYPGAPFCHDMAFFERSHRPLRLRAHGYFMRGDCERKRGAHERRGLDLSAWGKETSSAKLFIRLVGCHRAITTDRLHIAIAAALCRVPCTLLPSATGKMADVYDASLRHYECHARLAGDMDALGGESENRKKVVQGAAQEQKG